MPYVNHTTPVDKAMIRVCILDILEGTDADHPLTQDMIRKKLETTYGMKVDRKTVHRNLRAMIESIDCIQYREEPRITDGKESTVQTDFWIDREETFAEPEVLALIYSIIFNKNVPAKARREIVAKLEELTSSHLKRKLSDYISYGLGPQTASNEFFWNLELLSEAIEMKRKVRFKYNRSSRTHRRSKDAENEAVYTINPLGIAFSGNVYYLIALTDGVENTSTQDTIEHFSSVIKALECHEMHIDTYRLDHISEIELLNEPRIDITGTKFRPLKGAHHNELIVQEYLSQNPELKSGHAVAARFKLVASGDDITDMRVFDDVTFELADLFGEGAVVENEIKPEGKPTQRYVSTKGNVATIKDFALRHADTVELVEPADLREELRAVFTAAAERMQPLNDSD